ncbi:MAG: outer membrane protein assembly factor BamB family protein [Planctomycetota bacterium]
MSMKQRYLLGLVLFTMSVGLLSGPGCSAARSQHFLDRMGISKGICVVLGDPECKLALDLAYNSKLLIYMQFAGSKDVEKCRQIVDRVGTYGRRIYIDGGSLNSLHLADNLADAVLAVNRAANEVPESEVLRILRPRGRAILGQKEMVKPVPEGLDDWSHPYHGPDNNPQSRDQIIRAPYLTQFFADPQYGPSPQVAVASTGIVFKAFGNCAWHTREEPFLNKLVAYNGYNGTMLWDRDLAKGVPVHRNTMIATPQALYYADDKSCKIIHPMTGKLLDEIIPPERIAGGTYWKWMGLQDGILYALIGAQEFKDDVKRWGRRKHGWPWTNISKGYNKPKHTWGFGKNILAIDPKTKNVLWHRHEDDAVDSRAMCMNKGRIYIFRFGTYLACLDAKNGNVIWRKDKDRHPEFFQAMGKYSNRQDWRSNWRTVAYLKCSDKALYFAGPQMEKLFVVSADDGSVLWEHPFNNYQLVIRPDGIYSINNQQDKKPSKKFDPLTGKVLADLNIAHRGCTRVTGAVDSLFFRASGGSLRFDLEKSTPLWISPMRPQCHDGVTISNGMLYWWPWACDCQMSISGVIGLGPAGKFNFTPVADESKRLEKFVADATAITPLSESAKDWPTFRANNKCTITSEAAIGKTGRLLWQCQPRPYQYTTLTAPTMAGGLVFIGAADGVVQAFDAETGKTKWKVYTGGAIRFPPTIWQGRALVGSGDGCVYAFEAATGRLLWRFRATPSDRKIPVFGSLLSIWPVASGVIVEDGIAYFAAGILNYDGTYVYALDAATGQIKWQNNSSGHLYPEAPTGVNVQGHMLLNDGKLYLAGGTSVSPAIYDIRTGKCLNDPKQLAECEATCPRGWELSLIGDKVTVAGRPFYADLRYPVFDDTVKKKMLHASNGKRDIVWLNNGPIHCFDPLGKQDLNKCAGTPKNWKFKKRIPIWGQFNVSKKALWSFDSRPSFAVALCENAVVVGRQNELSVLDLDNGGALWSQPLSAPPVPYGLAVDAEGRVAVTLKNGKVVCFQ